MLNPERPPAQDPLDTIAASDAPREKCGIVGVFSPGGNALPIAYLGLQALQHRGQDGAGFSYLEQDSQGGLRIETQKALGRIAYGFDEGKALAHITEPEFATGHTRYETTESEDPYDALHPVVIEAGGEEYTIAHNGQFNMDSLFRIAVEHGLEPRGTDTELFAEILGANIERFGHIEPAFHRLLPQLEGAFNLSILSKDAIYAVCDRHNMRPYWLGRKDDAVMVASEARSLTAPDSRLGPRLDFEKVREITGGTYLVVNAHGVREEKWAENKPRRCMFEYTYVSKKDNEFGEVVIGDYRYETGGMLAERNTIETDMVVPVLGSAKPYAHGYADISGTPYVEALMKNPNRKNPDSDRTFIATTQEQREIAVRNKFIVDAEAVEGKKITIVDDSLVRGTTTRVIIQMLREAGAAEVHVRIGSDVFAKKCKFGVNVQSEEELVSFNRTVPEIAEVIDADTLDYLPLKKMRQAAKAKEDEVCDGCMNGSYPEPLSDSERRELLFQS